MPIEITKEPSPPFSPLERGNHRKNDEKRLEKACMEFESILIYQMIKTMRQTIPQAGFMPDSKERNIFQGLFDEEISRAVSKRGGLGVGKTLYQQMRKNKGEILTKEGGSK
ncbi:MAG: hypothetical protein FJ110_06450 [Deltaproteobacteria bacterium]|nr:hypothetical protein [Deltaproteobacteria bacterium]